MNTRRYFASTMRNALEMARDAQGSDVLILSNRKRDGGVEVVTALGEPEPAESARINAKQAVQATGEAPPSGHTDGSERLWTHPDTLGQMQRELGALKSLLEQQLAGFAWHDFQNRHPLRARLMRSLGSLGIVPHLSRTLVAEVSDTDFDVAWSEVLHAMHRRLTCLDDPIASGGVVAMCGASGVGKTSLVSKLAARYALNNGAEGVAIISTDEQRLGAHQQIKTFGRIVGIQVETARTTAELAAHLEAMADKALIVIDLPGYAPHHPQLESQLEELRRLSQPIKFLLAAAATTDYLAQMRIARAFSTLPLLACCLTKLDETAALGPAFSLLIEARLPLAYVCAGQQVPDDLECISSPDFLRRMLSLARQHPVRLPATHFEEAFAS